MARISSYNFATGETIIIDDGIDYSAEFHEPAPAVPEEISIKQFYKHAAKIGLITQAEALAAVVSKTLPASIESFIQSLPEENQFDARMDIQGASVMLRHHPFTMNFGAATGIDLDDFWRAASAE